MLTLTSSCFSAGILRDSPVRAEIVAPAEAAYVKIAERHARDPGMRTFQQRISAIHAVFGDLGAALDRHTARSLNLLLTEVTGVSADSRQRQDDEIILIATELYHQHYKLLSAPMARLDVTLEELKILQDYHDSLFDYAQQEIRSRAGLIAAIDKEHEQYVLKLCIIPAFLQVADEQWSVQHVLALPEWMSQAIALRTLETFALRTRRINTAYVFACHNDSEKRAGDYLSYVQSAASDLVNARAYSPAIHALRVAIGLAGSDQEQDRIAPLYFQLAGVLDMTGHTARAAEQLEPLIDSSAKPQVGGKAALLRLKYLHEAALYDAVLADSERFQKLSTCQTYLPEILYITWATHKRRKNNPEAFRVLNTFLDRYPAHPLGADLYFSSAIDALVDAEYEEVLHLLDRISSGYPDCRLMPQIANMRERVERLANEPSESRAAKK